MKLARHWLYSMYFVLYLIHIYLWNIHHPQIQQCCRCIGHRNYSRMYLKLQQDSQQHSARCWQQYLTFRMTWSMIYRFVQRPLRCTCPKSLPHWKSVFRCSYPASSPKRCAPGLAPSRYWDSHYHIPLWGRWCPFALWERSGCMESWRCGLWSYIFMRSCWFSRLPLWCIWKS